MNTQKLSELLSERHDLNEEIGDLNHRLKEMFRALVESKENRDLVLKQVRLAQVNAEITDIENEA